MLYNDIRNLYKAISILHNTVNEQTRRIDNALHNRCDDNVADIITAEQEITDQDLSLIEAEQNITDLDLRVMELENQ